MGASRVRALVALLREVWEIHQSGADPTAHASAGLLRLVGGDAGGFVLAPSPNAPEDAGMIKLTLAGFSASDEAEVCSFYQRDGDPPTDHAANALMYVQTQGVCLRRRELVDDDTWYGSDFVIDYRRRWRLDDSVYGSLRAANGNYAGVGCFRAWGSKPFSDEDCELIQSLASGCSGLMFSGATEVRLSRRQQQTLQHLLSGDSAKQIAAKLQLSIHTVTEYIQSVYRAHDVNCRAELLMRVLRPTVSRR